MCFEKHINLSNQVVMGNTAATESIEVDLDMPSRC